jgi:thioredoxin-like negative regulator of GroEL
MKNLLLTALLALAGSGAHAAGPASVDAALTQARTAHQPVLIDFTAPWCYSCYFMATHVLNGKEWDTLGARAILVEVDADSPDGAAWMKKLEVKALPAYVVLNEDGKELGRILAEQPREKFYAAVDAILAGASTLDEFKRKAAGGSADAMATVLASYQARGDGKAGLAWHADLPQAARTSTGKSPRVAFLLDRLALERARQADDNGAIVKTAQRVLAGDIGCDRPYVVGPLLDASAKLPPAQRKALLQPQKAALDRLLAQEIFVARPTCADQRSTVLTAADVDEALGDAAARAAVLDRGIAAARATLGDDLGKDRNAADNLRVYLTVAERTAELDALYPKLIAAYPDDYVYTYRYGRSLLERDQPAKALPLLEQAAEKAYGVNRLTVATLRVKALKALGRGVEARPVVDEVLEQNGAWFPEQVAALKAAI